MDILMSKTCWAHNKWNKIARDIKLVFHSSTGYDLLCRRSGGLQDLLHDFPSDRQAPKNSSPWRWQNDWFCISFSQQNEFDCVALQHATDRQTDRQLSVCCWKQVTMFSSCAKFVVLKVRGGCRSVNCEVNIDVIVWDSSSVSSRRCFVLNSAWSYHKVTKDTRRLTTGIRSEKCVVRRFRRCANVI